jgi:hypothetical protein
MQPTIIASAAFTMGILSFAVVFFATIARFGNFRHSISFQAYVGRTQ